MKQFRKAIKVEGEVNLLRQFILMYSILGGKKTLPPREEEFLLFCIRLTRKGVKLDSKLAQRYMVLVGKFHEKHWYSYRTKLLKKKWLIFGKDGQLQIRADFKKTFVDQRQNRLQFVLEVATV